MSENEMNRETAPDPVLGAAIRWVEGDAPGEEVQWEALRSNIRERAALPLARRRRRSALLGRWARPLVPLAAAASVAMAIWVGGVGRAGPEAVVEQAGLGAPNLTAEEVLLQDLSEQEFQRLVSGHHNSDELLLIAASTN